MSVAWRSDKACTGGQAALTKQADGSDGGQARDTAGKRGGPGGSTELGAVILVGEELCDAMLDDDKGQRPQRRLCPHPQSTRNTSEEDLVVL